MGMETGFLMLQYCVITVVVSLGTVTFIGSTHCTGQEMGPHNISRMDGENDVFIPCPFSGQYPLVWEINNRVYEPYQIIEDDRLPQQFIPASKGLLIPHVTPLLNGFSFRCLYPTGIGFNYLKSSLGVLTVTPQRYDFTQAPPMPTATVSPIYIDHQNTVFTEDEIQVSLKMPKNDNSCNHMEIHSRSQCDDESQDIKRYPITNASISISSKDLIYNGKNLTFFNISGEDHQGDLCAVMQYNFQVNRTVNITEPIKLSQTRGGQIIIPVIQRRSVFIVFPQSDSSSSDCPCAILITDNMSCTDLITCSCIEHTIFSHSLKLCYTTEGLMMDIENVTDVMNGARIFFFNGYMCEDHSSYWTYIASYEISIVLPEPPKWVNISSDMGEVCTSILSENNTITMVDNYNITVYDVTGETVFFKDFDLSNSTENCTDVGNIFKQDGCAPFMVIVSVHNDFGSASTNVTVLSNSTQVDTDETSNNVCSCLQDNVQISVSNGKISGKLSAEIYCQKIYYNTTVHLKAMLDADNIKNFSCDRPDSSTPLTVDFELGCQKSYNLSVLWAAPNKIALGEVCTLETNPVMITCHGLPVHELLIISIMSASAFLVLCICCTVTCVLVCRYCYKKLKKHKYIVTRRSNGGKSSQSEKSPLKFK